MNSKTDRALQIRHAFFHLYGSLENQQIIFVYVHADINLQLICIRSIEWDMRIQMSEDKDMRKYAWLSEPLKTVGKHDIYKIMLYATEEGFYLFMYSSPDAIQGTSDRCYDSLEELYEEWNDLIDKRGWIEIEDPLPYCQHDAFIPLRIKGRNTKKPEWGKFETLKDGHWVDFNP